MSKRLTPALRKQIISDYKHGIQNAEYRVIEREDGSYQVRKRTSKFQIPTSAQVPEQVPEVSKPSGSIENQRLSNEELLRKLSTLLEIPTQTPETTPQEMDQAEEAYEEDQNYIEQNINTNFNPYMRRPLRLY